MKKAIFLAAAALTLVGSAAVAQPYGYGYGYGDRYDRHAYRDSDRDGVPDVREWNRDRDHDGRPDQWDRWDNRRDHRHRHYWRDDRSYYGRPGYGYGQGDRYYGRGGYGGGYNGYTVYSYRGW